MTAKEAIKKIKERAWEHDIPSPCCPEYRELHEDMQDIMKLCDELIGEVRTEPDWIPCSERMPDKDGTYLATRERYDGKGLDVGIAIFVESAKCFFPDCTAWMPLPDPYKGGDEE